MYYIYLIKSIQYSEIFYAGYTTNLKQRLQAHNARKSKYTSQYRPWKLITFLGFSEQAKAKEFEKYLKSQSGRVFAKKRLW